MALTNPDDAVNVSGEGDSDGAGSAELNKTESAPLLGDDEETAKVLPVSSDGLTVRALITGCVLGVVVAAMNVSFGLKVRFFVVLCWNSGRRL
jgi:hypothetical protein